MAKRLTIGCHASGANIMIRKAAAPSKMILRNGGCSILLRTYPRRRKNKYNWSGSKTLKKSVIKGIGSFILIDHYSLWLTGGRYKEITR